MYPRRRVVLSLAAAGLSLAGVAAGVAAARTAPASTPASASSVPADAGLAARCAPAADAGTVPASPSVDVADLPEWQTLPITDVDGVTFTLADCIGTPVLVELFATWCPKCREQLGATEAAASELGADAAVLALSIETDLSPERVAAYQDDNGFTNIRFAVLTPEHLAALVEAFGNSAANAPSMPKFVIEATGEAGELRTGAESADDIVEQLTAAGASDAPATTG